MKPSDELKKIAEDLEKIKKKADDIPFTEEDFTEEELEKDWTYAHQDEWYRDTLEAVSGALAKHGLEVFIMETSSGHYWRIAPRGSEIKPEGFEVSPGFSLEETKSYKSFKDVLEDIGIQYAKGVADRKAGKPGIYDSPRLAGPPVPIEGHDTWSWHTRPWPSLYAYIAGYEGESSPKERVLDLAQKLTMYPDDRAKLEEWYTKAIEELGLTF